MSKTKKLVPKRRFGVFINDNEWKKNFLHEISEVYDGTHQTPNYTKTGIMFLSVENIKTLHSEKFISKEAYKKDFKIKPERNDILMTRIGDIGTANIIKYDIPIAYYVSLALIKAKLNAYFLKANITSPYIQAELWKRTLHIAFPKKINKSEIENVLVKYPDKKEQIQIGEFFKKLDILIQTQQKKLEKTKILKSAYLAEMFPADGESKPKIRFKNFDKIWNITFLGLISQIKTGESDAQDSVAYGKYPFFVRSENIERSNRYLFDGEAILIPGEGRLGEIFHYINGKFDYHQRVYKISNFSSNIDGKFIFYLMQKNFKEHALKYTVKATVDSLRLPMLTNYRLKQPTLQEQNKVSSFFVKLDKKIALEQRKLEKLNNIKQAYLNEMFV